MTGTGSSGPEMSEADQQAARDAIPGLFTSTPFMGWMGLTFDRYEPDDVVIRLPFRPDLTNDGAVYHGGVIATVLDTTGAAAAWSNHDFTKGSRASTVSMSVQYIGAAKRSDLVCTATVVKRGRDLIFTEIAAADDDGRPVAHAVQTYRIV